MNARKLADEIHEMLAQGLYVMMQTGTAAQRWQGILTVDQVKMLLRERANNLAQAYADRIEDESDHEVFEATYGEKR